MSPLSIDRVLAEMSETGTARRSVTKKPKVEPSLSPGEIPNSPNILVNIPSTSSKGGSNTEAQPATRTTQSLTAPATRPPRHGTVKDTPVINNDSVGGDGNGGRGPALPEPWAPATMWLSYECQRRHFNPVFKPIESRNKSGEVWYRCTVFLDDIIIHDNTKFATAADAKAYVAEKALQQVRHKWPMPGPTKGFQHVPPTTASDKQVSDPVRRQEELRQQLMRRNKSNIGETTQYNLMASSNIDMGDPAQARAFVEGYKMGQLAAQRAADEPRSLSRQEPSPKLRTRSRSPTSQKAGSHSRGGRAHRHRSPFREFSRFKGATSSRYNHSDRRHRSQLPSTDRYRPSHIDAEARRGRLREFDDGRKRQ